MKITRLTTAVVQANYDYTFVRIEADRDGLYGTGECFFAPGLTAILSELAPLLIGHKVAEVLSQWLGSIDYDERESG